MWTYSLIWMKREVAPSSSVTTSVRLPDSAPTAAAYPPRVVDDEGATTCAQLTLAPGRYKVEFTAGAELRATLRDTVPGAYWPASVHIVDRLDGLLPTPPWRGNTGTACRAARIPTHC